MARWNSMAFSTGLGSIWSTALLTSRLARRRGRSHTWASRIAQRTLSAMSRPCLPGTRPNYCGAIGCMQRVMELHRRRSYNLKIVARTHKERKKSRSLRQRRGLRMAFKSQVDHSSIRPVCDSSPAIRFTHTSCKRPCPPPPPNKPGVRRGLHPYPTRRLAQLEQVFDNVVQCFTRSRPVLRARRGVRKRGRGGGEKEGR